MAEFLATFGTAIEAVTNFSKYVLTPIKDQFSYLYCYNSNIQSLRDQVERLNKKQSELQLEVDEAHRNNRVIASDVQKWIGDVGDLSDKKERIIQDTTQVQQGCFYGICPNIKLWYRLSREARKTTEAAQGLFQEVNKLGKISYPAQLEPIPTTSAGIEVDSRKCKEAEIMKTLKDDKVYVIALCGMGGIGKTTMAKKIENKVRDGKIFEEVVMAIVSRPVDLKNVQLGIAEGLGLKLHEQTTPARAQQLHKRLKETESVLIILDDVWEKFNLQEIGIPSRITHRRCKVILTSRIQHVCRNIEDSAKIIQLDALPEQEAWNLFKEKLGEIVDDPNLNPIARDVATECSGLPLALVTVAAALRHSSIHSWRDALRQLKASHATDIPEVHEEVYMPLKWSYDQLQNEEARYLFLLCCLFPEDYDIRLHVLVEYGFALRIFANTVNLEQARDRVYGLVERLTDRFLLIRVDLFNNDLSEDYFMKYRVKMHDVIRDMAISIASKDKHVFLVMHDRNLRKWPRKDCYDNYTCISLSSFDGKNCYDIAVLEKIDLPRLELLRADTTGMEIQECSFDGMRGLKVLHTCHIKSLPSSLSSLTNLRSLFLEDSKLFFLPNEIGELMNLEILRLYGSWIEMLPKEIGKLKNLRLLDLNDCGALKSIPPGVISGLVQLEELYMNKFNKWEGVEDTNASVAEVASLTNLRFLQLRAHRRSINFLQDFENWHKLTMYYATIGDYYLDIGGNYERDCGNFDRCINIKPNELHPWKDLVQVLSDTAQSIELEGRGSAEIANKLLSEGHKNLERLVLARHEDLEFLFDSNSWNLPNAGFLPRLTTLVLILNDALKEICHRQPPTESFSNLTSIQLFCCGRLKNLFSFSVVAMLSKLEFLEIMFCDIIEAVFLEQNRQYGDNAIFTFPKLSKIKLHSLPRLSAFCKAIDHVAIEFPQLYEIKIEDCSSLKSFRTIESSNLRGSGHNVEQRFLFNQKVMPSGLKKLALRSYKIGIFDPRIPIDNFIGLERVHLYECSSCVNLFTSSMSRVMHNLKYLNIDDCKMLQEVIAKDDEEQTNSKVSLFPQLKELQLWSLPKMQQFCHMSHGVELPSLEILEIRHCSLMETFSRNQFNPRGSQASDSNLVVPSFFDEITCNKLKELKLGDPDDTIKVFGHYISIGNLRGLEMLHRWGCHKLRSIFSPGMLRGLVNLQKLQLSMYLMLQEVISKDEKEGGTDTVKENIFPHLKELELSILPRMQQFCHMSHSVELPSLEVLKIKHCRLMETFSRNQFNSTGSQATNSNLLVLSFFDEITCNKLKELKLKHVDGATELFGHKISIGNFRGLEIANIRDCQKLRSISSPGMFRGLVNLQLLRVMNCPMLQEVISKDGEKDETDTVRENIFPQLKIMLLSKLPKLIRFCHFKNDLELPSLERLVVSHCPLLEAFSLGSMHLPSSTSISAENLGLVEGELSKEQFESQFLHNKQALNNEGRGTIPSASDDDGNNEKMDHSH